MSLERWKIPLTWTWCNVEAIADVVGGSTPTASDHSNFSQNGIPWITPSDLTGYRDTYIERGARDLSQKGFDSCGAQMLPTGTVLFSSRAPIGYCVIARTAVSTNQGFKSLVLKAPLSSEYIRYYLLAAKEYAESEASGTTFKELSGSRMKELALPLAPETEQRRIAAKLDSLLARSSRARHELDRIPKLIERYKQAILAKAFSGELTANWRVARQDSGAVTLSASGIDGRISNDLTDLPDNWCWTSISQVADVSGGLTKNPTRALIPTKVSYLRVANIYANELRLREIATIGCTPAELQKTRLQKGDLLIVEGNGSLDQIGRVALWNEEITNCSHQNHIIRARPRDTTLPLYMLYWLLSPMGRMAIERAASSSSGLHTLSITKVSALPAPICERVEQAEIVRRIEIAFAWLDKIVVEHARAAHLLPKLGQAILAKAFRGELVPQDPNDEPASTLLDRIRAERQRTKQQRGRRLRA